MKQMLFVCFTFLFIACEEIPSSRPAGQIFIQDDYCACQNGQVVNINTSCQNKCSEQDKDDNRVLLSLDVTVGEELQNSQFKNLKGWCTENLTNPHTGESQETANPDCELVFTNKYDNLETIIPIDSNHNIHENSIKDLNISMLAKNTPYFFEIREVSSQEVSDYKDISIRTGPIDPMGLNIPLTVEPISQYACIKITDYDINNPNKRYFYYDIESTPDTSISTTFSDIFCHDSTGELTNSTPLLDNRAGHLLLWRKGDLRFSRYVDQNGNSHSDTLFIDEIITNLYEEISGLNIGTTIKLFNQFNYFSDPIKASEANTTLLGYMMKNFQSSESKEWYCPTKEHYYAVDADPLMKTLREVIVYDTQPLYYAKQQDQDDNYIFITKKDVQNAWFYLNENNQEVAPTDSDIKGKKIQFYWPISEETPLVKKSHQVVYTIQEPSGVTNPADVPDDKRIGCVPNLSN